MSDSITKLSNIPENTIANEYYFWLCELIKVNQTDRSYWLLIKTLHNKIFTWTVPNDGNRIFEGKKLREMFCEEYNYDWIMCNYHYEWAAKDVSMLELILGLAYRCENIMVDQGDNACMGDWFWRLLTNIGVYDCTDEYYSNMGVRDYIDQKLDIIINRTYKRNGLGGLFPLKKTKHDQRKVELWYQMGEYLVENYYISDKIG